MPRTVDDEGKDFLKGLEGCKLVAYQDDGGVWTIAYGSTRGVRPGDTLTQAQADELFELELPYYERIVNANVLIPLTQKEFNAIVAFVYNVGPGRKGVKDGFVELKAGGPSTLLRKLNDGDKRGAAKEFPRWCYVSKGEKKEFNFGVKRRHYREARLFLRGAGIAWAEVFPEVPEP